MAQAKGGPAFSLGDLTVSASHLTSSLRSSHSVQLMPPPIFKAGAKSLRQTEGPAPAAKAEVGV